MNDCKAQFEEFKNLCARLLRGENLQFLRLIQKRYDSCNEQFRTSPQMQELLKSTSSKLMKDEKHMFIHLRDFVTELKAWAVHSNSSIFNANGHKRKAPNGGEGIAKRARADDTTTDCSDVESTVHKTQNLQLGKFSLKEGLQLVGQSSPASPRTCVVNSTDTIHVQHDNLTNNPPNVKLTKLDGKFLNGTAGVESDHKNTFLNCIGLSERGSNDSENSEQLLQKHNSTFLEAARVLNKPKEECISSMDSSDLVADTTVIWESKEETSELSVADCGRGVLPSDSDDKICLIDTTVLMSVHDVETAETITKQEENVSLTPEGLGESKQAKHVKRLERLLEQIRDKIEQIREAELSLNDLDAEDSSYILEDRLQKKFVKVWKRLCDLTGRMPCTGRPVEKVFKYEGTRYPELNRKISKFVNRRKIFPDYHDIHGIVKKVNTRLNLKQNANQVNNISREAFLDVGEALQSRRHKDFISTFRSKQTLEFRSDQDPALFDEDLQRKLNENRRIGMSRLDEVVSKYSNLQFETGEEPKEVPDGSDADRSHKSEDDEEDEEDPREEELRDGETEENKEESEFLVELDLDESYNDCGENIFDGNIKEIGDVTVSSKTMFANGSIDEDDVPTDIVDNNVTTDRVDETENGFHEQEVNLPSLKRTSQRQKPVLPGTVAFGSNKGFQETALKRNCAVDCGERTGNKNALGSILKIKSPVKVTTCVKIPRYLTRPAESRSNHAFYPSKTNSAVSVHVDDNSIMVIDSSDEEDSSETTRQGRQTRSPLSSKSWPSSSLPSLHNQFGEGSLKNLYFEGFKVEKSTSDDENEEEEDDLIVLSD